MLNIVCTSKPADGLLFYSYEYCSHLNEKGIDTRLCIITHRDFTSGDYTQSISDKYIHCKNVEVNNIFVGDDDVSMILGNSMMTLAHMTWNDYSNNQQLSLKALFSKKLISVYSENHPKKYPKALSFFNPKRIINLCDTDVYPNGPKDAEHFEKIIHFPIYKEVEEDIQFDHLFLGTNREYYKTVQKVISDYPDHGILTYHQEAKYLDLKNTNLKSPVPNLLGKFKTYVYTKDTFDPAPRLFQECRWLGKEIIYHRTNPVQDGGYWYWKRGLKNQDIGPIITALNTFKGKIAIHTELASANHREQFGNLPQPDDIIFSVNKEAIRKLIDNGDIWFCSIPHIMAFTDEEGNYAPCNFAVRSTTHNLYNTSLKEWMTGDIMENLRSEMTDPNSSFETVNKHCSKCINDETNIKRSRRMIANELYRDADENLFWDRVINSANTSPYIFKERILEIQVKSFGIECNLDCHMCFHFSSSIRTKMAFENGVYNAVVWGDEFHRREQSRQAMKKKPVDKINRQIVELGPYIYNLKIIGGEPLVMKKHYELLDMLIESGDAANIQLKYQTNGTTTKHGKHNIFDYIPKFKTVLITVSLDGVGKYNEYIRRRGNFNEIVENINEFLRYRNVRLELNSVVTFFSVLHLYKMAEHFEGMENHWWPIDFPQQMKANNLPQDIKDRLIPIYEDIPHMKEIATLLRLPAEENFQPKELYKYCIDADEAYKGTKWEMNVLDVFPELKPHYLQTVVEPQIYKEK